MWLDAQKGLVALDILGVPTASEISEVALYQRMFNRKATLIWFQILFSYIRLMLGTMWQHLIPRTVLGWSRTSHHFIPFIGSLKVRIDMDNYASVVEQLVAHDVTD